MNKLVKRVFCPQCGAIRICQSRSAYAVCPNGHGRLVPRFTAAERRKATAARLPRARRVGSKTFVISRHHGQFVYRNGNGRRPAAPSRQLQANEVLARHVTRTRTLVRVFTRKNSRKTKG